MTPVELSAAAAALIVEERRKLERLVRAHEQAILTLCEALQANDKPALWRALVEASKAEYDLSGEDTIVGKLHDTTITCECYAPGDPCSARTDCEYCREKCPLK